EIFDTLGKHLDLWVEEIIRAHVRRKRSRGTGGHVLEYLDAGPPGREQRRDVQTHAGDIALVVLFRAVVLARSGYAQSDSVAIEGVRIKSLPGPFKHSVV